MSQTSPKSSALEGLVIAKPMTLSSVETRAREMIASASLPRADEIVDAVEEFFMADMYGLPKLLRGSQRDRIEDRLGRILYACAGQSVPDIHIALTMAEIRSLGGQDIRPELAG